MALVRLRILGESLVEVGDQVIGPDSPRLFALALYVGYAEGRPIHKSELSDLLFPEVSNRERASHNLRQLLYRLRRLGAAVQTVADRVCLPATLVASGVQTFAERPRADRVRLRPLDLAILPAYEPRISRQFSEWLETVRVREQARVRGVLRQDFAALEQSCDWDGVISVGRTLQELQMATEDVACGVAQALVLRGQKHEALQVIDSFLDDCDPSSAGSLRQLRGRIARVERFARVRESAVYGRHHVLQQLARQWENAVRLIPQLAVLAGPAGIGKTRMSQEISSYARLHGGQCVHYTCDRSDSARPYALFRALLPQLRRMRGSLGASPLLQQHLDLLTSEGIPGGALEPALAEAMRKEIQQALIDLLEAISAEKPLLIVVDDAQLQDAASRSVINALVGGQVKAALMIACCHRTTASTDLTIGIALHNQVYQLAPLSTDDGVAVLSDLLPDRRTDAARLRTWASRAGGNPYYLHAMAYSLASESEDSPGTFDISRFAASVYYALSPGAKTVYEACVLLGPLSTITRLGKIAKVDGAQLVSALRELETTGMIRSEGSELRCAHALLEEATSALIPRSVAAFLHSEIAAAFEAECHESFYPALAWAAADHWIAIGDVKSAASLLERCASQAAALGEPLAAAQALEHIPFEGLDAPHRAAVLRRLADYAEAAGDFKRVADSMRALRQVGGQIEQPDKSLEIDFRIIESDLRHGAEPTHLIPKLQELIANESASSALKVRAAAILMIAADSSLRHELATATYDAVSSYLAVSAPGCTQWQERIEMVFHTAFGDARRALEVASELLALYAYPTIETAVRRRNIGYTLLRLGQLDIARDVMLADYDFMVNRRIPNEIGFRMILLSDIAIQKGCLDEAQVWVERLTRMLTADPLCGSALQGGYYSSAAELALATRRWNDAEVLIERARRVYPAIQAERFLALALSVELRAQLGRSSRPASDGVLSTLHALYAQGKHLGMQDTVVEALWLGEFKAGRPDSANKLLLDYLTIHRREIGPPSWTLKETTGCDPAWSAGVRPVRLQ